MLSNMGGPTLIVIVFIVLLLFGAPKLPGLAKSLGQSMRILKKEVRSDSTESSDADAAPSTPAKPAASEPSAADEPTPGKPTDGDGAARS